MVKRATRRVDTIDVGRTFEIPRLSTLAAHAAPRLLEGTIVPLALFYSTMWALGTWGALVAALGWSYGALAVRVTARRRVPGVLLLGALGLAARTAVALATGSVFVYFLQPALGTVVVAGAFLLSVPVGRPLAERLAADLCPLPGWLLEHPRARVFFARVSLLWGLVLLANAGTTIWLLLSQSLATFLWTRSVASLALTTLAIAVSAHWFRVSMRRDGVVVVRARRYPAVA